MKHIFLKDLRIGHIVRDLASAVVVFLKFLIEADDNLQMRSGQRHHLVHSESMSSSYNILNLDRGSAKLHR